MRFESEGTPAVMICSDMFAGLARNSATLGGRLDLPVVTLPHPVASRSIPDIEALAAAAAGNVAAILVGERDDFSDGYQQGVAPAGGGADPDCEEDECLIPPG